MLVELGVVELVGVDEVESEGEVVELLVVLVLEFSSSVGVVVVPVVAVLFAPTDESNSSADVDKLVASPSGRT